MSGNLVPFPSASKTYVVDTWPVMEWLKDRQPQADLFQEILTRANRGDIVLLMSWINLGEVYYTSAREWGFDQAEEILERMLGLAIEFASASNVEVMSAARLKIAPGMSYADCFAASLAIKSDCALITGDPEFRALQAAGVLQLEWLGA